MSCSLLKFSFKVVDCSFVHSGIKGFSSGVPSQATKNKYNKLQLKINRIISIKFRQHTFYFSNGFIHTSFPLPSRSVGVSSTMKISIGHHIYWIIFSLDRKSTRLNSSHV